MSVDGDDEFVIDMNDVMYCVVVFKVEWLWCMWVLYEVVLVFVWDMFVMDWDENYVELWKKLLVVCLMFVNKFFDDVKVLVWEEVYEDVLEAYIDVLAVFCYFERSSGIESIEMLMYVDYFEDDEC